MMRTKTHRNLGKLACIVGIALFGSACTAVRVSAQPRDASQADLEGAVDPYGDWIMVNGYGRAWRPIGMPVGWRPYTAGTWTWIDEAWTWRSDYPWGWAAFHYGRWYYDAMYGWVWIPGNRWGPAWVAWHVSGGYVGWSPLGPRGWRTGPDGWCYVQRRDFGRRHVRRVLVRPASGGKWNPDPLAGVVRTTPAGPGTVSRRRARNARPAPRRARSQGWVDTPSRAAPRRVTPRPAQSGVKPRRAAQPAPKTNAKVRATPRPKFAPKKAVRPSKPRPARKYNHRPKVKSSRTRMRAKPARRRK